MITRPTPVLTQSPDVSSRTTLTVSAYGVYLRLDAPDAGVMQAATVALPPTWEVAGDGRVDRAYAIEQDADAARFTLWIDGSVSSRHADWARLLDALGADAQMFVAEMAPGLVFLHAGVVAWRGAAIVLPGQSWSGKTTLVSALIDAGATYYSDEYAVLDNRGRVHPYPQPLAVRTERARLRIDPRTFRTGVGREPLRVGAVVLTEYRPSAAWAPELLSPGQAVLALVGHTVSIRRQPDVALGVLNRAVAGATVLRSTRGEASAVADAFLHGNGLGRPGLGSGQPL